MLLFNDVIKLEDFGFDNILIEDSKLILMTLYL